MNYTQLATQLLMDCQDMHSVKADPPPLLRLTEVFVGKTGVLTLLFRHTRPMLAGELASTLGLSTGRMASILKGLEGNGLVHRVSVPGDKRRVSVSLTPEGIQWAQGLYEHALAQVSRLLEDLGESDARDLLRLIEKMKQMAQRH